MSMSNASFVSQGLGGRLGGGRNAKDILSQSILENSMQRPGNTSIMDIKSGYNMPSMQELNNRSMSISKPPERSFLSSQKSFYSRKNPERGGNKGRASMAGDDSDSFNSDASGDESKNVESISDESERDSDDVEVNQESNKLKSTGFFQKQRLRDILKAKG